MPEVEPWALGTKLTCMLSDCPAAILVADLKPLWLNGSVIVTAKSFTMAVPLLVIVSTAHVKVSVQQVFDARSNAEDIVDPGDAQERVIFVTDRCIEQQVTQELVVHRSGNGARKISATSATDRGVARNDRPHPVNVAAVSPVGLYISRPPASSPESAPPVWYI